MLQPGYLGLGLLLSEILLGWRKRATHTGAVSHDAGTLRRLWIVIAMSVTGSILVGANVEAGRFGEGAASSAGLVVFAGGIALRWWSILTLGRFFTVDVAIDDGHRLVTRGPYRVLRHPSYTGLLAAFAGLGLTFGSWPALLVLMLPITGALVQRIRVEERALAERFGAEWIDHCARTARLVPFVW